MNELEDIKLRKILQDIQLESPDTNFSARVMDKIREENEAIEKIKAERILGKGFWVILILFIILLGAVWIFSFTGNQTVGILDKLLQGKISATNEYQNFIAKLGVVPISVAGILIASSILLFIDRFINSNLKVFSDQ